MHPRAREGLSVLIEPHGPRGKRIIPSGKTQDAVISRLAGRGLDRSKSIDFFLMGVVEDTIQLSGFTAY